VLPSASSERGCRSGPGRYELRLAWQRIGRGWAGTRHRGEVGSRKQATAEMDAKRRQMRRHY
jgi:hypothetical protein